MCKYTIYTQKHTHIYHLDDDDDDDGVKRADVNMRVHEGA